MDYKEALKEANRRANSNYIGQDERGYALYNLPLHSYAVHVIHEEGTNLFLESANAEKVDCWWFVYSEHHGVFVYHEEDVDVLKYKRIYNSEVICKKDDLENRIDELEEELYWLKAKERYGED